MRTFLFSLLLVAACAKTPIPAPRGNGFEVGNGGVVVICPEGIELLDLYRARVKSKDGFRLDLGKTPRTAEEKARFALARLSRLDPARAARWTKAIASFRARSRLVESLELPDTRDYGDLPKDAACHVEQAVVQSDPRVDTNARFLVHRALWERLDESRRAALMLHEIIYEEAIARHQKDSLNVQSLVALLCSRDIDDLTQLAYNQLMVRLGLSEVHEQPPVWRSSPLAFDEIYCAGIPLEIDLRFYAYHPAKDLLSFEPVSFPSWLEVDSSGRLRGTPPLEAIKDPQPIVRATNGVAYSDASLALDLRDCAREPIVLTWLAGVLQHGSLPYVFPRLYRKESGAEWLFFNPKSGDLSGTAPEEAIGDNRFVFGAGDLRVTVVVKVLPFRPERFTGARGPAQDGH